MVSSLPLAPSAICSSFMAYVETVSNAGKRQKCETPATDPEHDAADARLNV